MSPVAVRPARDRTREIWIGVSKEDKTLTGGKKGEEAPNFLGLAGFSVADKFDRVDDYRLVDGPEFAEIGVRVFNLKPKLALDLISRGALDAALVGRDVLKEFNVSSRGKAGMMQGVEIAELGLAPCALTVAVRDDMDFKGLSDLNGRKVATKYPASLKSWARMNKITFGEIVEVPGGVEGYYVFDSAVTVICDMVEFGQSLAVNGWRVPGIDADDWYNVATGKARFCDLPRPTLDACPCVIVASTATMVRTPRPLGDAKETALEILKHRFMAAAQAMGKTPVDKAKKVATQNTKKRARVAVDVKAQAAVGHGWRHTA